MPIDFPSLSGNWVDLLIIVVLLFYAIEGYGMGFVRGVSDLLGFILSFTIALTFYSQTADLLIKQFSLSRGIANAAGFFLTAFVAEIVLVFLLSFALHKLLEVVPSKIFSHKLNRLLGMVPGVATALVLTTFFLSLIMTLPLSPYLKSSVSHSWLGSYLAVQSLGFEKTINQIFGKTVSDALNFLTIQPRSEERVNLNFQAQNLTPDPVSEQKMLALVNKERGERGLKPLIFDTRLRDLARRHARDMFKLGYFSHYTPEGLSPFDRMAQADITFNVAGENLALAPNVELAHRGLMESKGHRENILSADFGRVGIGVIDGGIYGKMFVQEFTD